MNRKKQFQQSWPATPVAHARFRLAALLDYKVFQRRNFCEDLRKNREQ